MTHQVHVSGLTRDMSALLNYQPAGTHLRTVYRVLEKIERVSETNVEFRVVPGVQPNAQVYGRSVPILTVTSGLLEILQDDEDQWAALRRGETWSLFTVGRELCD